jgi:DNA-binding MurR/RpiR family transcriptional regulator
MPDFEELVRESIERFNSLSPEEQNEHRRQQYISWARGEMGMRGQQVDEEELARAVDNLQASGRIDYRTNRPKPKPALERLLDEE